MPDREGFFGKRKRLLEETFKAFSSELKGERYVPGREAAAEPEADSAPDKYDQLAKLSELRKSGALTEEEFEREKAKLLSQD